MIISVNSVDSYFNFDMFFICKFNSAFDSTN